MAFSAKKILRDNIKKLKAYSSARDEYTGKEGIFLDANENPIGSVSEGSFNRYPDPLQWKVKERLSKVKHVAPKKIFLGNGSDEAIDLLYRAFCEPKKDNVVILPPTYGMYKVCADINDVEVREVLLTEDYDIDAKAVLKAVDGNTKLIFVCSPNNPTGNLVSKIEVFTLLEKFKGIVVVDEAYIDFAEDEGFMPVLDKYPNLVVMQTFSKAWGMAALRLGMAFASEEIINILNSIKYPYNINASTQEYVLDALENVDVMEDMVGEILDQRDFIEEELEAIEGVEKIYPSDSNSVLIKVPNATKVYEQLIAMETPIIVRDRSKVTLCEGCLRITVGTRDENLVLLDALASILS